jgi:hypothetical protein
MEQLKEDLSPEDKIRKKKRAFIRLHIAPLLNGVTKNYFLIADVPEVKDHYIYSKGKDINKMFYLIGRGVGDLYKDYLNQSRVFWDGERQIPFEMFMKGIFKGLEVDMDDESVQALSGYMLKQVNKL